MKSKFVLLSIMAISLFGCNGHSSEYSKNPPKPSKWGHRYDSVFVSVPIGNNITRYFRASKHILDTFTKQYDTSVYKYIPISDSIYTVFVKGGDSVKDVTGHIIYDSVTKKAKITTDQTYQFKGLHEVSKTEVDTTKLK